MSKDAEWTISDDRSGANSTKRMPPMKNTLHRIGAGTAAALLVASGAGAGSAFAALASDVLLLTIPAEDVKEIARDVGDLDIFSAESDKVIVLGEQELADELEEPGADVSAESYASAISSGVRPSQASVSRRRRCRRSSTQRTTIPSSRGTERPAPARSSQRISPSSIRSSYSTLTSATRISISSSGY